MNHATNQPGDVPPPRGTIVVGFDLSDEDWRRIFPTMEGVPSRTPKGIWKTDTTITAFAVAGLVLFVMTFMATGVDRSSSVFAIIGMGVMIVASLASVWRVTTPVPVHTSHEPRTVRFFVDNLVGRWVVTVGDIGISISSPMFDTRVNWSGLGVVYRPRTGPLTDYVILWMPEIMNIHIPRRAFDADLTPEAFVSIVNRRLYNAGHGLLRRAVSWLADHDFRCPRCNYNLRGARYPTCTECGHVVLLHELPRETFARPVPELPAQEPGDA